MNFIKVKIYFHHSANMLRAAKKCTHRIMVRSLWRTDDSLREVWEVWEIRPGLHIFSKVSPTSRNILQAYLPNNTAILLLQ